MKLLMLKGLPASGKTTFARTLADAGWVRVNKDDLRAMLHNSKWNKLNEKQVLEIRDLIIENSLKAGKSVVVDDTGFHESHTTRLKEIAKSFGAIFETKFFDTPLDECIKRDLKRPNSVGEQVIRKMWREYLAPKVEVLAHNPALPEAILCDLDGTLCHMNGRGPYDWTRVGEDKIDEEVQRLLLAVSSDATTEIIFISGRDGSCYDETRAWLEQNDWLHQNLYMRTAGDNRKDFIVKRELYEKYIKGQYNVRFVLDDRRQVVDMWRSLGLKVLQVAEGDF